MEPKYILVGLKGGPIGLAERPTQENVKTFGEGSYVLHKGDGTISKKFRVVRNKNSNLQVQAESPTGLEGISTLNLTRMQRDYGRIVKLWPTSASARDANKVTTEIQARAALVSTIQRFSGDREAAIQTASAALAATVRATS